MSLKKLFRVKILRVRGRNTYYARRADQPDGWIRVKATAAKAMLANGNAVMEES